MMIDEIVSSESGTNMMQIRRRWIRVKIRAESGWLDRMYRSKYQIIY
jgi:hypothetical protein